MKTIFLVAVMGATAVAEQRFGAVESRPLWERPGMGLTLQGETEAALDRGNGRVVDEQSFLVGESGSLSIGSPVVGSPGFAALRRGAWRGAGRGEEERFWVERERQLQIDQAQQKAQVESKREKVVELESVRLAAERERWLRMMNKPRHGEAAVVDEQMKRQGDKGTR